MNDLIRRSLCALFLCVLLTAPVPALAAQAPRGQADRIESQTTSAVILDRSVPARLRQTDSAAGIDHSVVQSGRLIKQGNHLLYLRSNGHYAKNTWRTVDGKKYYFSKNNYAVTGLHKIGGSYYLFDRSGVLQKGWILYQEHWYYASPNSGRIRTGWQTIGGNRYFLSRTKQFRLTGIWKVDDKRYFFNGKGILETRDRRSGNYYIRFNSDGTVKSVTRVSDSKKTAASTAQPAAAPKKTTPSPASKSISKGQQVADFAKRFVGNPYKWGGESLTKGADCSGFVKAVYAEFGIQLPHYDASIRKCGTRISSLSQARPGDVICYNGHVAIYLGNNRIVHAASTRQGICIGNNASYMRILSIRRFF